MGRGRGLKRKGMAVPRTSGEGVVLVAWAPSSRRLDELSKLFGGSTWKTSILFRHKASAPIKYLVQAIRTWNFLVGESPKVIVVQNPPIFAPLTCLFYAKLKGKILILDHHCVWSVKSVKHPPLRQIVRALEAFCCRKARLNTVPNQFWAVEVKRLSEDAKVLTLVDFVDESWFLEADLTVRGRMFPGYRRVLVAPCGGNSLERPDIAVKASTRFKGVALAVTGAERYLKRHLEEAERLGAGNVFFTGYLPEDEYKGLIATCDAVVNITDEPLTVPHFICEALAAGKPVVTSDNPAVRSILGDSAVYVKRNDVEDVAEAIGRLLDDYDRHASNAKEAYERLKLVRVEQEKMLRGAL